MVVENNLVASRARLSPGSRHGDPRATWIVPSATSGQAGLPAEFKHINKRRKETNEDSPSNGERTGKSPA
ncbi:uncharacterized protein DS421_7g223230 [Arachis hypogaea]|nr:uncharacterized protein DS421_7g223230 [Arachis hypogaea]